MSQAGSTSAGFYPPGTLTLKYTPVSTTPYVVLDTDEFLGVDTTTLAITILLPDSALTGRVWIVKDNIGLAITHNITVTTVSGIVLIDGATTVTMNTAFEALQFLFNGTEYLIF
jgi:hypothetical protein